MTVNKKNLYNNYISKLEKALNNSSFDSIDYILTYYSSPNFTEEERSEIEDIVDEATLYLEMREDKYKEEALVQIWEFKEEF